MSFGSAAPIFRVASLRASLEYYVEVLGFTIDWEDPASIASVSRDRCCLFLCEGDQGNAGSWTWIGVGDAEALYREYTARGAKVRNPPSNFKWALEMQIEDLDGNVLRMGSEPKTGERCGPWRDMNGDLWLATPAGGWIRQPKG